MENRWTLHIEEFGRIKEADVTVGPLTLFVGDNNSGKSYLMALIYALLGLDFGPFDFMRPENSFDLCRESPAYEKCMEWIQAGIEAAKSKGAVQLPLSHDALSSFKELLCAVLKKNWLLISKLAFNEEISIGDISISFPDTYTPQYVFRYTEDSVRESPTFYLYVGGRDDHNVPSLKENDYQAGLWERFLRYLLGSLVRQDFRDSGLRDLTFLPTSRTGFLLTYRTLTGNAMDQMYQGGNLLYSDRLTRPCSDFLSALTWISPENAGKKYVDLIRFMEKTMLEGRIVRTGPGPLASYVYRPSGQDTEIPMFLSSGVVTELTPLLLMLQYKPALSTLFIEEPEMALHPALQKRMAQVLIRLCNTGTPVFATTHSDTILQHVNDMIMLSRQPEEQRRKLMETFYYEESDLIGAEDVSMYELTNLPDGSSSLHACSAYEYGFEVPRFIDALDQMLNESRAFEPDPEA